MMYFSNNDQNIFFVHIPRTGGRYIKQLLQLNQPVNNMVILEPHWYETNYIYKGKEIMHLSHELLVDFNSYKKSKKFAVVRDPLSRFISATQIEFNSNLNYNWKLDTVDKVLDYITFQQNCASYNNWYKPQHEFVSEDCLVYKFENGFKENFKTFMSNNFNITLTYMDLHWEDTMKKKYVLIDFNTNIIQEAVRIAYKNDYDRFYN